MANILIVLDMKRNIVLKMIPQDVCSIVLIYLVTISSCGVSGSKILLLPTDHHSHVNFFAVAAKSLRDAGHDTWILTVDTQQKAVEKHGIQHLIHTLNQKEGSLGDTDAFSKLVQEEGGDRDKLFSIVANKHMVQCKEILENNELMTQVKNMQFDLVLVDGIDFHRCLYVFPYKLGIPYITLTARHDPWNSRIPSLPSVEGLTGISHLPIDSCFMDRLKNLFLYLMVHYSFPPKEFTDDIIDTYAADKPKSTFAELYRNSEMWLINLDITCLDYHHISAPHFQFIGGGVSSVPPKPLSGEFADFYTNADEVVLVTFGSGMKKGPADVVEKMMAAFSKIPQKVIMRHDGEMPKNQPANVKLSKWMPQNDLLGHPKTKLFITHGGNNGQLEAVYHGVPMLTMPFFGDQTYNAKRVIDHDYGLMVDPNNFSSQELTHKITEIITNPKYSKSIKHCSAISKSLPSAEETLVFWVNHILQFGGSHLKPKHIHMPLWKFFMLDIMAFCLILDIVVLILMWKCCKFAVRKCRGTNKPKAD